MFVKSPNFGPNFSQGKNYALLLTKNRLGYIMGYIFSQNSSGHPAPLTPQRVLHFNFDFFPKIVLTLTFFRAHVLCRLLSENEM
jgi:hypothetical protein